VSELETKLRQLAKNGEFTHLSVVPVAGKGEYGATFVAQVSPASRFGYSEGRDPDPVKAILDALDGLPKLFVKERAARGAKKAAEQTKTVDVEPWDIV
jgi:hypothetical protein